MAHNRSSDTDPSNQSLSMTDIPSEVIEKILTALPNFTLKDLKSIVLVNHFFLKMAPNISFAILDEKKWDEFIKTKSRQFLRLFRLAKPGLQNLHAHYHTEFQKNNRQISKIDAIKIMAYALVTEDVSSLDPEVLEAAIQQLIPEHVEALLKIKHDELESLKDDKANKKEIESLEEGFVAFIHLYQFTSDLKHLINGLRDPQKVNTEKNPDSLPQSAQKPFFKNHVLNFSGANLEVDFTFRVKKVKFVPHFLDNTKLGKTIFSHCIFLENNLSGKTLYIEHVGTQNEEMIFSSCHLDNTLLLPHSYREGYIPTISLSGSDTSIAAFKVGNTLKNQIDFLPHTHAINHRTVNTSVILQLHLLMNDMNSQINKLSVASDLIEKESIYKRDQYLAKVDLLCQFIRYIADNLEQPITTLYEAWAKKASRINFFRDNGEHIKEHFSIPDNISNFEFLNLPNDFSENVSSVFSTATQSVFNFFNASKQSDSVLEKQNHSKETQDIAFIIKQSSRYTNEPKAQSTHQKTTGNTAYDADHQSTSPKMN